MRTIRFNVYTIDELKEDALPVAMESIIDKYMEYNGEHAFSEIVDSAIEAAKFFGMRLANWSVGYYQPCYTEIDASGYMELSNREKNGLVDWLNENIEEGVKGLCQFTGVTYDSYFFDYVKDAGGVTYNNIYKVVPEAIDYMVSTAARDEERTLEDSEYMREYAKEMGWKFYEDGTFCGYGL